MRTILSCLILMCLTAIPLADTPLQPAVAGREGRFEQMLSDISAMVLTVIPKGSVWRRFTIKRDRAQEGVLNPDRSSHRFNWDTRADPEVDFSGWLLAEDNKTYKVLDLFAQERVLEKDKTTISDRTLADDVEDVLAIRSEASLPEALFAAWAFAQGDRKDAAAVLLPCLDRLADEGRFTQTVRDLLAGDYHQQMLEAFTRARDYPAVLRLTAHLAKPQFEGWQYFARTKELAEQLAQRGDDFKTLTLPTPSEWKDLQSRLDRPTQAEYLAKRLRLLNAFQWGQPGKVKFERRMTREPMSTFPPMSVLSSPPGTEVINPLVELTKMKLEVKELPALLPYLDDENFVLAYGYWRNFHSGRTLYRVNSFVARLINVAATTDVIDWAKYSAGNAEGRQAIKDAAPKWIQAHSNLTRTQLLLGNLKNGNASHALAAAQEFAQDRERSALGAIFDRIAQEPDDEKRAALAECCFHLDAAGSVPEARKWLAKGGDLEFWGALVLFAAGDAGKHEGVAELKDTLAADGPELNRYRKAFDTLQKSCRPEGMDLAGGVLGRLTEETDDWDGQPFVQRLLLAGRQEAVDFLFRGLDDNASDRYRRRRFISVISPVSGDYVASMVAQMRTDGYMYPLDKLPKQRAAERAKLKTWLTKQVALIRAGRRSAISRHPLPLVYSTWIDAPR